MSFLDKLRKTEHSWVEESLSAYMDDELSAAEKARVERHLDECQACARSLSTLRQTVALLKELPTVPAPRSFAVRRAAVTVERRAAKAAPAWGYGLLRGATALAALLLVLLVGGDLALQFVGGAMLGFGAAAPPPQEVALAPHFEPSFVPAPAEEEPMLGQSKDAEGSPAPMLPANAEDAVAPPPEAAETTVIPQETCSPEASVEGVQPPGTPTAAGTPAERVMESQAVGAGEEPTPAVEPPSPSTAPPDGEEAVLSTTPTSGAWAAPEEEARAAAVPPTVTAEVMAMAAVVDEKGQESGGYRQQQKALPMSPLRMAEFLVLVVLVLLVSATVVTGWLRRRAE